MHLPLARACTGTAQYEQAKARAWHHDGYEEGGEVEGPDSGGANTWRETEKGKKRNRAGGPLVYGMSPVPVPDMTPLKFYTSNYKPSLPFFTVKSARIMPTALMLSHGLSSC